MAVCSAVVPFLRVVMQAQILLVVLCTAWVLLSIASPAVAANPFLGERDSAGQQARIDTKQNTLTKETIGFTGQIIAWQMKVQQSIAAAIHRYKKDGRMGSLLWLFGGALVYGIIHAVGPGHGKAIAMTYALARGRKGRACVLLGCLIAFFHAGSALLVVIVLRLVLEHSVSGGLETISRVTKVFSYGLISVIGLFIFLSTLIIKRRQPLVVSDAPQPDWLNEKMHNTFAVAFAIGMVPCPGVVTITLFCLTLDQMVLGLLLAIAVSVGMAATITLTVWVGLIGKKLTLGLSQRWTGTISFVEHVLHALSGLLLTTIGVLLLISSL